jgi:DNA repair protein RadC
VCSSDLHNHPSGNLKPSAIDIDLTDHLFQVGRILNINVLDHLIISTKSYMSFADTKLLEKLAESPKYVPPFEQIERIRAEEKKIREEAVRVAEEKGIKKGEIRGEKKKAIEMARILKQKGVDIAIIIESSGLTKKEIEKIK